MYKLHDNDYKYILKFYNITIPKTKKYRKIKANKILASKFCACIKKFNKKNESMPIGLCTKSVIGQKGFIRGNFTCNKKQKIKLLKKYKTKKYRKK